MCLPNRNFSRQSESSLPNESAMPGGEPRSDSPTTYLNDIEMAVSRRYAELQSASESEISTNPIAKPGLDCPSIHPQLARSIIGVCGNVSTRMRFVDEEVPIPVTLHQIVDPQSLALRARFVGPCITSGCKHWTGAHCRLGQAVADVGAAGVDVLPNCAVRGTCRWFLENGPSACTPCQHLRYLTMAEEVGSAESTPGKMKQD